ncbi:uncharacterized protein LOC128677838 [Plodia interpunctella]|uniref:uncharacterized protein LOC128677838 n=1 Tax=Plodia interpunctella TaxID=58824 RepID=UPI00236806F3|nr:uncharacterized protein LOC128677838 [Plodia interpunctella]
MDRPSTSHQSVEKIEVFEVREHVPYKAEVTRAPAAYDEESGELYTNSWDSAWKAICQLINLLHHMQVAIVVFCIWHFALTSSANGEISSLELHIIFAGTGYQLFLVEAVLTLHPHNSWSFQLSRDAKRIVHGCLQLIGALFVMTGSFLGLSGSDMTITGAHGICGVIALAFTLLSFISGLLALFSAKVRLFLKARPVKILHIAVGLFAICMGLITMAIGFNKPYFTTNQESLSTGLMVFVVMILLYVVIQPVLNLVSTTKEAL